MRAIIQELARETQVKDREGQVITSFTGKLGTVILRVFLAALFILATTSIVGFTIGMINDFYFTHIIN